MAKIPSYSAGNGVNEMSTLKKIYCKPQPRFHFFFYFTFLIFLSTRTITISKELDWKQGMAYLFFGKWVISTCG